MNRLEVARMVDHTVLKPETTTSDVMALCIEAEALGVYAVCVSPTFVLTARATLSAHIAVATVCGFPSGKHESSIKAAEARLSVEQGADEVDMVIDVGQAIAGNWSSIEQDIAAVRAATDSVVLKVILETAALDAEQIRQACLAAQRAGADFVKTSTGFHPSGGASVHAVEVMHKTVGGRLGIKASGGIKTWEQACALIDAGATRLGLSGTRSVLDGAKS
jgi:deoxyribose-phosphate aldolase